MKHYLYRRGDGNDGNFPRCMIALTDDQNPYAALAALVAGDFIIGHSTRRHVMANIETEGEPDYGILATVYEGPQGEQSFGAAWLTAELEPMSADDVESSRHSGPYSLREYLDDAAWRFYRRNQGV